MEFYRIGRGSSDWSKISKREFSQNPQTVSKWNYHYRNRGSYMYMSAHVLLNLLNELGKRDISFSQRV